MIKESGRQGMSHLEESHANMFNQTEYENLIVQLQEQIDTLNEKLIESSFQILEQKQTIKKLEMQDKEKEFKIKSLNQKIELINKAQKDKRNRHLKEIYNIKKTTYMALQKFVTYPIYDEKDESFYDFESNLETILEQIISQQKETINYQQNEKIQFNQQQEIQKVENQIPQTVCKYIDDYLNLIKQSLNQNQSFCKNIEDNKTISTEIRNMISEIKRNPDYEQQLQQLLVLQQKISQVIV